MISNAPLERLITLVMAIDGLPANPTQEGDMRCLMRKIEWVANEAETVLRRGRPSQPAVLESATGLRDAA